MWENGENNNKENRGNVERNGSGTDRRGKQTYYIIKILKLN